MRRKLCCLCVFLYLSGCAPLAPHDSFWGGAAEVVGRTIIAPLTLGTSEWMLAMEAAHHRRRQAYAQWYRSLPPDQQDREDRRSAAQSQALGFALSGGGPFRQAQTVIAPTPTTRTPGFLPHMTCLSLPAGTLTTMDCW